MPKSGGEKALTKHPLHDEILKTPLTIDGAKVEVVPKMIDNSIVITGPQMGHKPKDKMKVGMVKTKAPAKRTSRLCKATEFLYDLEEAHGSEKTLNINLDLYQMEDY